MNKLHEIGSVWIEDLTMGQYFKFPGHHVLYKIIEKVRTSEGVTMFYKDKNGRQYRIDRIYERQRVKQYV